MSNTHRLLPATIVLVAGCLIMAFSNLSADPPPNSQAGTVESLDVQYARAHFELAKLDLQRALDINRQSPRLLSERTIGNLRKQVEVDREKLTQVQQGADVNVHDVWVRAAEVGLEIALEDLDRRRAVFDQSPDDQSRFDLDRARAVVRVAKINLQRMKVEPGSAHTLSYLQWQIEELRNQVLDLEIKLEQSQR